MILFHNRLRTKSKLKYIDKLEIITVTVKPDHA